MNSLRGYDAWKLSTPWDDEPEERCGGCPCDECPDCGGDRAAHAEAIQRRDWAYASQRMCPALPPDYDESLPF